MRFARALSCVVVLIALCPTLSVSFQVGPKKPQPKETAFDESIYDEKTLRAANLAVDGAALLQFFRERTHKGVDPKRLAALVQQLGDAKFSARERAYGELLAA